MERHEFFPVINIIARLFRHKNDNWLILLKFSGYLHVDQITTPGSLKKLRISINT